MFLKRKVMKKFDITVLLDRSGSMQDGKDDFVGGLRSFISDQKNQGDTDFTLVQFDSQNPFELVFDGVDVNTIDIDKVELVPRGGTPLLDALGKTIAHIENRVKTKLDTQPILMVLTDGAENSSKEWSKLQVKKAIEDKKSWKIMFLGADIDAFDEASSLGILRGATINTIKTATGIANTYSAMSNSVTRMRSAYSKGMSNTEALCSADYTQDERDACMDIDALTNKFNSDSTTI